MTAASGKNAELVKLLIEQGADVNANDSRGRTVLGHSLDTYHDAEITMKMVDTLLRLGARADVRLDPRAHGDLTVKALKKSSALFALLVDAGLDVNARGPGESIALHEAVERDDSTILKHLLEAGADVEATDSDGYTALHHAVLMEHLVHVRLLVSHGAKVARKDKKGQMPMHLAFEEAGAGFHDILDFLLETWADQNYREDFDVVLYMALAKGHFDQAEAICVAHGSDRNDFHTIRRLYAAASEESVSVFRDFLQQHTALIDQIWLTGLVRVLAQIKDEEKIDTLLALDGDLNARDPLGETALHVAARSGDARMVSILLHANTDLELENREGDTALSIAVGASHCPIVTTLIERGANTAHTNHEGSTCLHSVWSAEIASILISNGAPVNAVDLQMKTPLHCTIENEDGTDITQCLLSAGADVNARDESGRTPFHMVCELSYQTETLQLMLNYNPDMSLVDGNGHTPLQIAKLNYSDKTAVILEDYLSKTDTQCAAVAT